MIKQQQLRQLTLTITTIFLVVGFASLGNAQVNVQGFPSSIGQAPVIAGMYPAAVTQRGPGTEMTRMINRLGLGSDCSRCQSLANQMDQGGSAWVRQNRQFVVQQTISNATNLGHQMGPARKLGVRMLVNRAILKSK